MSENQSPIPDFATLPASEFTLPCGYDLAADPGLAQLHHYLPVLAVIAAPFASMSGTEDPLSPADPAQEWLALLRTVRQVTSEARVGSAPLALVRLLPPTSERLGIALSARGPDAFRIVHLIAHAERDILYLEDEEGREAYAVAEHIVRRFASSDVRLVLLDGCFSRRLAQMLLDETPVQAVIGTVRRANEDCTVAFNACLYAELAGGASVREAFRAAIAEVRELPNSQPERYELVLADDQHDLRLPLPEPAHRATRPLVADGLPRAFELPLPTGFIGRRELLGRLAEDMFTHNRRLLLLTGPQGVGKRSLAAAFAYRFGWRFPDGIVWLRCGPAITAAEVQSTLAQLAGLPSQAARADVLTAWSGRRLLLVLQDIDALPSGTARAELATLLAELLASAHHGVLLTAQEADETLLPAGPTFSAKARPVEPLTGKDARTLAMRRAVLRRVETLDVDTIDDFLERTQQLPWLIIRGVEMVRRDGVDATLKYLSAFDQDAATLPRAYLRRQLEWLLADRREVFRLLIRAQGLPAPLDERLALGLAGRDAADHLSVLLDRDILQRDGTLIAIPAEVRAFVWERFPLDTPKQAHLDRVIAQYFAQTWPDEVPTPLPAEWRARLSNVRALLDRQLSGPVLLSPVELARLLVVTAPAFLNAGLAEAFLSYATALRGRLPEGDDLARLQMAMGTALAALPGRQDEAGWLFQVTLTLEHLSRTALAEASLAYGRHLLGVGQSGTATDVLARAFRAVMAQPEGANVRVAAMLAHEWGRALAARDQHGDAIKRFEGALAGYARTRQVALSATAQRDLGLSLLAQGDSARAEDVFRRALATADFIARRDLAADLRRHLAGIHLARAGQFQHEERVTEAAAEMGEAVRHLHGAIADALTTPDRLLLAHLLHDLARAQAQAGMIDDGAANAARAHVLFTAVSSSSDLAEASITLGQLRMAQGDSVRAQAALHEALDLAQALNLSEALERAATVLVRVHQIRARHALQGDQAFRRDTIAQAEVSRRRLAELNLAEHAAALERIAHSL